MMPLSEFRALFYLHAALAHPSLLERSYALDNAMYWACVASMQRDGVI